MARSTSNRQPSISVRALSKSYGRVQALHDVSFDVEHGKIFGLIGPDGSGKTTLFRILTTLLLADAGKACVDGFDVVRDMNDIRKRVGYMPGHFSLYQDLTVEENLKFFATLFSTTIAKGYDLIAPIYSQIERFKTRRAGALSGGMKQKLALCCALVHKPSILFLDEPTTGVDPVSRKEFWEMLVTLKQNDITIVVSTPYIDEVLQCDCVAFLHEGRLKGVGNPKTILTQFKAIFNPPMLVHEVNGNQKEHEENVIQVQHLVKSFGDFRAVDDISFNVRRGEIFGFLGANGAGKKRHIGYMSQKFSLYEDLTVTENIQLFGHIYGMKSADISRKLNQLLQQLQFTDHANDIVSSLPLGWKQKLAFSISIFHEPDIVFLDEPTGGVDPATRQQFWTLIYDAARSGITIFVTTHYMDEAEYCDRISIMVDGKISAIGTPSELKSQFNKRDMNEVFTFLARQSNRQSV